MKKMSAIFLLMIFCLASTNAHAQKYRTKQKEQVKAIKAAYKNRKVTPNEYHKLLDEQQVIVRTIEKYEADGYITLHEKEVIQDKLQRAADRLRRYKTNSER